MKFDKKINSAKKIYIQKFPIILKEQCQKKILPNADEIWATFSKLLGLGGRVGNTGNTNSMEEGVLLRSNHPMTTSFSLLLPKQDIHQYGGLRLQWLLTFGEFSVSSLKFLL